MADLAAPQEFWADKWDSKMTGWKVGEALNTHVRAYELLANLGIMKEGQPARIMVPLAGDGIFSPFAYAHGHTVVASELVGSAVESLRARFNEGVAACRVIATLGRMYCDCTVNSHDASCALSTCRFSGTPRKGSCLQIS